MDFDSDVSVLLPAQCSRLVKHLAWFLGVPSSGGVSLCTAALPCALLLIPGALVVDSRGIMCIVRLPN